MIAAIQTQWLGVAVAALIVAVLLLVVLIRRRGGDDRVMAADKPAGPAAGSAAPAETATSFAWPPAAPPDIAPSRAPQWAATPAPVMAAPLTPATAVAEAPAAEAATVTEAPAATLAKQPLVTGAAVLTPIASPEQTGSFLDEPLTRGFEGLGKPAAAAAAAPASHGPFPVDPFGSHEDIFPPEEPAAEEATAEETAADEATAEEATAEETAADEPVAQVPAPEEPAAPPVMAAKEPEAHAPVLQALTDEAPMAAVPAAEHDTPTLLSEIIVTTGDGEVDLGDPAVRGLLTQLVSDEIELAKACCDQAQTLDAILQLTEAEKICEALGLDEQLAEVRTLLSELQA